MNTAVKNESISPLKFPADSWDLSKPAIRVPPSKAKIIPIIGLAPTCLFKTTMVITKTTRGCSAARTDALAILVILTAVNHEKKWANKKAPARNAPSTSFFDRALSSSLLLSKTGIAKNGSPSVSLQNPIAMDGASMALPKIPEEEPATTANNTIILTYFFKKFSAFIYFSNIFRRFSLYGGYTTPFSVTTAVMYLLSVTSKEGLYTLTFSGAIGSLYHM